MTYNNDGQSYSHNFTVDKAGPISIFIYAYESSYIKANCFADFNWSQFNTTYKWNDFNKTNYSPPGFTGSFSFSFEFDTYIQGPITGSVNFYAEYDDGMQVFLDGNIIVDNINNGILPYTASWSNTMTQGQLYKLRVRWQTTGSG